MRNRRRQLGLFLVAFGLVLGNTNCGKVRSSEAGAERWYRAHILAAEQAKTPFFLQLPDDCTGRESTIVNGQEWIRAPCHWEEERLRIDFPVYGTRIEAAFDAAGNLSGTWRREDPPGAPALAFVAEPVSGPNPETRFDEGAESAQAAAPAADFTGTWRIRLGRAGTAKAIFVQQASGVVSGTVDVPAAYGDLRFLAGNARNKRLEASTFDGQVAVLLRADMRADGKIQGGLQGHRILDRSWDEFVGERVENFVVSDPLDRVRLMPGRERLDLDPELLARYAGKALIVDIFGTWCPGCGDHAQALGDLYREYHSQGLEILGLAFEFARSRHSREERVRAFKTRHDVQWDVVIADAPLQDAFGELSMIEGVPVTIFVNRDGTVHAIYTGFSSPATGEAYRDAKAQFRRLTEEILDSAENLQPAGGSG